MNAKLPLGMLQKIQIETDLAIKRGWDSTRSQWRTMALKILCEVCLEKREFTVNDFRNMILNSGIVTHDNRAMGGLMATAKKWGWIKSINSIPSRVGHKTPIQVWRSCIYQEPSTRELVGQQILL